MCPCPLAHDFFYVGINRIPRECRWFLKISHWFVFGWEHLGIVSISWCTFGRLAIQNPLQEKLYGPSSGFVNDCDYQWRSVYDYPHFIENNLVASAGFGCLAFSSPKEPWRQEANSPENYTESNPSIQRTLQNPTATMPSELPLPPQFSGCCEMPRAFAWSNEVHKTTTSTTTTTTVKKWKGCLVILKNVLFCFYLIRHLEFREAWRTWSEQVAKQGIWHADMVLVAQKHHDATLRIST